MEIESSIVSRLPFFKKKIEKSIRTEYPNQNKSWSSRLHNFLAGVTNMFSIVDECDDEDDGALTQEKVEDIVQTQLENYHKKLMQELKDLQVVKPTLI